MSTVSRAAAQQKRQHARIQELRQQINGYKVKFQHILNAVADLQVQFQRVMKQASTTDPCQSHSKRIDIDIVRNHGREPNGRRYSLETLLSARELHSISPQVWRVVRRVLPLPSASLFHMRYAETGRIITDALQDDCLIDEVLNLSEKSLPMHTSDRTVILACDAVAFRPLVTVDKDGTVHGLKNVTRLDDQDLFAHFLQNSLEFTQFLEHHWIRRILQWLSTIFSQWTPPCHVRLFTSLLP
jgi:hypothetical protein